MPKSSVAQRPPSGPPLGKWLRKQYKQHSGLLFSTCLTVACFALFMLWWNVEMAGDPGGAPPLRGPFGSRG